MRGHHTAAWVPAPHPDLAGGTAGPDVVEEVWAVRNVMSPIWVACCIATWLRHLCLPSESKISQPFNSLAVPPKSFHDRLLYSSLVANRGADGEKKKCFSDAAPPSSLVPHSWDGGNLDMLLMSL